MTYTTEQVVELYNQYIKYKADFINKRLENDQPYNLNDFLSFEDWLKDKEKSELPQKHQLIWVRDTSLGIASKWREARFAHLAVNDDGQSDGSVYAYLNNNENQSYHWDEYSLTDPNS